MKLVVKVIEARNIRPMDVIGSTDAYVRLQLGRQKFRTKTIKKSLTPYWGDEFYFRVDDPRGELVVTVMHEDKYFNDPLIGTLKLPISNVFDAADNTMATTWYSLQPKPTKKPRIIIKDYKDNPEISLHIYLSQFGSLKDWPSFLNYDSSSSSSTVSSSLTRSRSDTITSSMLFAEPLPGPSSSSEVVEQKTEEQVVPASFDELLKGMDPAVESPANLPGGVLIDQLYSTPSNELNSLLFGPDSKFPYAVAEAQGKTELQFQPWKLDNSQVKRECTYINPPSKLVKAVKAYEDQTYLKAGGTDFVVLVIVSTPDVMYGSTFKVELLYCIAPGSEEQSSRLVVSWRVNFVQSTMMKGMIENGARQALKDTFDLFSNVLGQHVKPVETKDVGSKKEQILASLQAEPQSDWKLAVQYFANFTVVLTVLISIYVLLHLWMAAPSSAQGLEMFGLDLPDSIAELIVSGVLVLQAKRMFDLVARFMQARMQKKTDHGIKAQGEGWLLTVALIEGSKLAAVDSNAFSDPYVVFTCNGKTRTSSIKFQKLDPLWNEIFEFDAMYELPSVMEMEVFDFDGPFKKATSLGHAEINFLKSNISELADVWVPLQGKLAKACQSKLRLMIFLDNTLGGSAVGEYLAKMEKEVGKKISQRSPQTNSAFQKLFCLPPEEFLINDFTCHLKRKMPLQGRLFLSSRIIGFHANLFGHKTKFFFLWEDIEDIQVASPNLSSMGSPIIVITLRKRRGLDARHGAKTMDEEGRLKFHFHSFVSFSMAHRTIMALWKARSLSPEQKVKIVAEESESSSLQAEESATFVGVEEVTMSEIYASTLPLPMNFLMEGFSGGDLDKRVMERTGCLDYSCTPWEVDRGDIYERQICYKFDKRISTSYTGGVTGTQQKSPLADKPGWLIQEVSTLHGVPLSDSFNLHIKYQIEDVSARTKGGGCSVKVSIGMEWLKSSKQQKRIWKNMQSNMQEHLKVMFGAIEKEYSNERKGS